MADALYVNSGCENVKKSTKGVIDVSKEVASSKNTEI
jgi:hypothetical protein